MNVSSTSVEIVTNNDDAGTNNEIIDDIADLPMFVCGLIGVCTFCINLIVNQFRNIFARYIDRTVDSNAVLFVFLAAAKSASLTLALNTIVENITSGYTATVLALLLARAVILFAWGCITYQLFQNEVFINLKTHKSYRSHEHIPLMLLLYAPAIAYDQSKIKATGNTYYDKYFVKIVFKIYATLILTSALDTSFFLLLPWKKTAKCVTFNGYPNGFVAKWSSYSTCVASSLQLLAALLLMIQVGFTTKHIMFTALSFFLFLVNTLSTVLLLKLRDIDKVEFSVVAGRFQTKRVITYKI
jgi:hypothetical protein